MYDNVPLTEIYNEGESGGVDSPDAIVRVEDETGVKTVPPENGDVPKSADNDNGPETSFKRYFYGYGLSYGVLGKPIDPVSTKGNSVSGKQAYVTLFRINGIH